MWKITSFQIYSTKKGLKKNDLGTKRFVFFTKMFTHHPAAYTNVFHDINKAQLYSNDVRLREHKLQIFEQKCFTIVKAFST